MHTSHWEVCYEILDYESKLLQIKLHLFQGLHEFNFLEIYYDRATFLIFDWKKYTLNSIYFYYLLNSYLIFLFCLS